MHQHHRPEDKNSLIDPRTPILEPERVKLKLTLRLVIAVIVVIVTATATICTFVGTLTYEVKGLRQDFQKMSEKQKQSWTVSEQLIFAQQWKQTYPTQPMPDVMQIVDIMNRANAAFP